MQRIAVRKPYDAILYDSELDMINLKCENIYIYRDVKRFFELYRGNWDLERIQDLIVASTYNHRKEKNLKVLKSII